MKKILSFSIIMLVMLFIVGSAGYLIEKAVTDNNSNYTLVRSFMNGTSSADGFSGFDLAAAKMQAFAWFATITTPAPSLSDDGNKNIVAIDFTGISEQAISTIKGWFQIAQANTGTSSFTSN
jgi:hypothetical protein